MIKQKIIKLRKKGFSLREISRKLNASYRTVGRTCFNVKMSKDGLKRYSKLNGLTKQVLFKDGLSKTKVRLMSNLLFDGGVYVNNSHYTMMYVNSSKGLITQFVKDMKEVYNVKPSAIENWDTYQRVKYFSRIIYYDMMKYFKSYSTSNESCLIPSEIINGNNEFKLIILRAFWENEGSIGKDGKLSADSVSHNVIKQLSKLHNEFGLKHNISRYWKGKWAYKLFLLKTKDNYKKFIELGLFSKANVTRGYNKGKKKVDVLHEYYNRKF